MRRMLSVRVGCLIDFHGLNMHPEFISCVRGYILPVEVNTGYLHSYTMSLFNNIDVCPQVNLILVYFARLDERNLAVGVAILGINYAFPYHVGIAIGRNVNQCGCESCMRHCRSCPSSILESCIEAID